MEYILAKYDPATIETALVQVFVEANNILVRRNSLIKNLLEDNGKNILSVKLLLKHKIEIKTITDLVNIFELLVPADDKKTNGTFFTPKIITDFIVSQTITSPTQKICDPSCGCGAFLTAACMFICEKFKCELVDVIEKNLYGVDVADYSIRRAKILLSLLALKNGEDKEDIKFNLKVYDSLTSDWKKLFPEVIENGGFDVVIGNPPYVRFQDLNKELRNQLYNDWLTLKTGNYNLYFAFFELGIDILKPKGILGYITPNNYFTSLAGVQLREYLASNKLIEKIVDFNHLKLFEAQTYTCITFLKKEKRQFFYYERMDNYELLDYLDKLHYSKVYFDKLNNNKWRLLRDIDQDNIKRIENIGKKLGELTDIRVGIATCKDSVYFIDGATLKDGYYHKLYQSKNYPIEKEICRRIAKISDFKTQKALDENNRWIIFPYQKIAGKMEIIPEKDLKRLYPCCYKYFLSAKEDLAARDKGRVEYTEWYAYARTQGLNFYGKKLLTPTFSSEPRFLLEKNENALFCNGYAIYMDDTSGLFSRMEPQLNLAILRKILNSCVMDYYIKQTSVAIEGGYPCYQKNFIELFGIPDFSTDDLNFLKNEENKARIDAFLIKKYGISIQEIRYTYIELKNDPSPKPANVHIEKIFGEMVSS